MQYCWRPVAFAKRSRQKAGLVWYTDRSKIIGTWVYKWRSKRGYTFILGLHTMVFHAEIYDIMAYIMENTEMGYKDRNTYIIPDSQAAIKALNFQMNSQLVWKWWNWLNITGFDWHGCQTWLLMGMARQGSSCPLIGPEPALGICAKVARGEGAGRIRNMRSTEGPFVEKGKLRAFFKDPLLKRMEN